jgi:hypothetical protein
MTPTAWTGRDRPEKHCFVRTHVLIAGHDVPPAPEIGPTRGWQEG